MVWGILKMQAEPSQMMEKLKCRETLRMPERYTSTGNEDSLIMTGTGLDTLTTGSAIINYLTINKTTPRDIVRLGGSVTVNKKLDYLSGVFTTDPILHPSYIFTSPCCCSL